MSDLAWGVKKFDFGTPCLFFGQTGSWEFFFLVSFERYCVFFLHGRLWFLNRLCVTLFSAIILENVLNSFLDRL